MWHPLKVEFQLYFSNCKLVLQMLTFQKCFYQEEMAKKN